MDPRLLRYYNQELAHVREMGAEFALQFPKIAARLGMDGIEVSDPYVERLLEGLRVPGRPRTAQARRRVSALHPAHAGDHLPAVSGADAVDADRAVQTRPQRFQSGSRIHRSARQFDAQPARQGRPDGVRVSHRARCATVSARGCRSLVLRLRARPAVAATAGRQPDQGRAADPPATGRRSRFRADRPAESADPSVGKRRGRVQAP